MTFGNLLRPKGQSSGLEEEASFSSQGISANKKGTYVQVHKGLYEIFVEIDKDQVANIIKINGKILSNSCLSYNCCRLPFAFVLSTKYVWWGRSFPCLLLWFSLSCAPCSG